jgi:hypothetical protein
LRNGKHGPDDDRIQRVINFTTSLVGRGATIRISEPLKMTHDSGVQVSGTGITFAGALTKAHPSGTQAATHLPTPGAPNQYIRTK